MIDDEPWRSSGGSPHPLAGKSGNRVCVSIQNILCHDADVCTQAVSRRQTAMRRQVADESDS
jgi:hypothetical protein